MVSWCNFLGGKLVMTCPIHISSEYMGPFLWGLPARHRVIGSYLLACWRQGLQYFCNSTLHRTEFLVVKGNFLIVDASFDILNNLEHGHWKIIRTTSLTLRISTIPLCWAVIGFRIRHVEDIFGMVNVVVYHLRCRSVFPFCISKCW